MNNCNILMGPLLMHEDHVAILCSICGDDFMAGAPGASLESVWHINRGAAFVFGVFGDYDYTLTSIEKIPKIQFSYLNFPAPKYS